MTARGLGRRRRLLRKRAEGPEADCEAAGDGGRAEQEAAAGGLRAGRKARFIITWRSMAQASSWRADSWIAPRMR